MKYLLLLSLQFFALVTLCQDKTQVMIVGTYHMDNPGLDKFNMEADDITSSRRQKEIEEFVELLKKFNPTVICLESDDQRQLSIAYSSYRDGKSELRKNEVDQLGFRLARKMGLKTVYAIDASAPFEMDSVVSFAQRNQFNEFMSELQRMPEFISSEDSLLRESNVTQYFQHVNSPSYVLLLHQLYLKMATVGKDANYVGADAVADWYKRNLRIYRNLQQLPLKSDDRVLILYGVGHAKILQDLVSDSPNMELIDLSALKVTFR